MVHRGTPWYKNEKGLFAVEFKTLFSVLKKHMGDGDDIPYFFRELMAMITTVTEDEWGTCKDPSNKVKADNSIRTYVKRPTLPKKLAQAIVYRLTPEILIERINEREKTVRELLAEDLQPYDATMDANNVAKKVADIIVEIIQISAGLAPKSDLEKQQQQQLEADLNRRYGEFLLQETDGYCPFPGCGRQLHIVNGNKTSPLYKVSLIDKTKTSSIDNLIALCPNCYTTYQLDDSKQVCKELKAAKRILSIHKQSVQLLDNMALEKGIIGVIGKIKDLKQKDLVGASLDPKEIKQKLDPDKDLAIYGVVNYYVNTYFLKVKEIMMSLDKRGIIDYEETQDQMKAFYRNLKKKKLTKVEIFNEIVDKIHRVSLQENIYCQIVVAYFIQSCEVFDVITK